MFSWFVKGKLCSSAYAIMKESCVLLLCINNHEGEFCSPEACQMS